MSKCESCESKSENGRTVSWILATRIAGVSPSVTMHNVSPLLIHAIIHGKWTSPHPHTPTPHSLPHPSPRFSALPCPCCFAVSRISFDNEPSSVRGETRRALFIFYSYSSALYRLCFCFLSPFFSFFLFLTLWFTQRKSGMSARLPRTLCLTFLVATLRGHWEEVIFHNLFSPDGNAANRVNFRV